MEWVDDALIVALIGYLVVRQFMWRKADPGSILKLPLIVVAIGAGWLVWEVATGQQLTPLDAVVLLVELLLVSGTGTMMGLATRFGRGRRRAALQAHVVGHSALGHVPGDPRRILRGGRAGRRAPAGDHRGHHAVVRREPTGELAGRTAAVSAAGRRPRCRRQPPGPGSLTGLADPGARGWSAVRRRPGSPGRPPARCR